MLFGETVAVYCEKGERKFGDGSESHYYRGGGSETIIFYLKVPRHCPLVLLIKVRLEFRVNYTFIYMYMIVMLLELEELALERNLVRH
jgi:hypothetical protein